MTLSANGINYICYNFGDISRCCVDSGLGWYYTRGGVDYPETGATAQIVSRLASGIIDSLTMTNPARGMFTKAELDAANGSPVTLEDAQTITYHDNPSEDQWCFNCINWTSQIPCESSGCYWYNGGCYAAAPSCEELNNQSDCVRYGCYWWGGSCHSSPPPCDYYTDKTACQAAGCYWWEGTCHDTQKPLCQWIIDHGGPADLDITEVFQIVDSFVLLTPPPGYSFIPTITEVFGVVDYFLGFNGDAGTGCSFY